MKLNGGKPVNLTAAGGRPGRRRLVKSNCACAMVVGSPREIGDPFYPAYRARRQASPRPPHQVAGSMKGMPSIAGLPYPIASTASIMRPWRLSRSSASSTNSRLGLAVGDRSRMRCAIWASSASGIERACGDERRRRRPADAGKAMHQHWRRAVPGRNKRQRCARYARCWDGPCRVAARRYRAWKCADACRCRFLRASAKSHRCAAR